MKFRSLFMALLSAAFMVGCAEQLPPVETFVEAEKQAFPKGGTSQQVSSDAEVKKNEN